MSAASSPNQVDDQTGWINRLAHLQHKAEEARRGLKGKSRFLYVSLKLTLVSCLIALVIAI
jgi:hypothetical protein